MCRVLAYLGPKIPLADLMLRPANSLVNQSFAAEYHHLLQLGGSGFASWEAGSPHEDQPLLYKGTEPAFFDSGLRTICENVRTTALLAHVRAIPYSVEASIHSDNCHPFLYPGFRLAIAHNGGLPGWREMLHDILMASRPEIVANLTGSTDTEALYCLLMSQFDDPTADLTADEIVAGMRRFMGELLRIKHEHNNSAIAKLKLFMADGNDLVVANIGFGPDYATTIDGDWEELRTHEVGSREFSLAGVVEPVWYLAGTNFTRYEDTYDMAVRDLSNADTVIIASEPLTRNASKWHLIPFQHVAVFERRGDGMRGRVESLDLGIMERTPSNLEPAVPR